MTFALLLACADPPAPPAVDDSAPPAADTAPDPCADLTWLTTGGPFTRTWCATCHSEALTGARRAGAPVGVDLDDEADVRTHAARVRARALGDAPTMPPVVVPPLAERRAFEAWLDCAGW